MTDYSMLNEDDDFDPFEKSTTEVTLLSRLAASCDALEDLAARYQQEVQTRTALLAALRKEKVPTSVLVEMTGLSRPHLNNLIAGRAKPSRPDMRGV